MSKKHDGRGRGRPEKYVGNKKSHILGLFRREGNNATRVKEILNASKRTKLATKRSLKLFPHAAGISMPTLLKIAHRYNLKLHVGRSPKVAKVAAA